MVSPSMRHGPNEHRQVIHWNVADFAVAVERIVDIRLRERPVLVGVEAAGRAAVYDMSEEAFQAGVRKGMLLARARKICPESQVVSPHPDRYERAMKAFRRQVHPYSPLVEAEEITGHLFADVTGTGRLFGPPQDIAWHIRKAARAELGLDPIWSLASNKLVAKVATRVVKPLGEQIVLPGDEETFLRPLPLHLLPGLDRDDLTRFREFNISRIGQAALWTPDQLMVVFGTRGRHLHGLFRGADQVPVLSAEKKIPTVALDHEFADDTNDRVRIEATLYDLVERAGSRIRKQGRAVRRVGIFLDYTDGRRVVRQKSANPAVSSDTALFHLGLAALDLAWRRRIRIRRVRLVLDRLTFPPVQMTLFPEEDRTARTADRLSTALDRIRTRFGPDLIRTGRTLVGDH